MARPIYGEFDQATLDLQYNARATVPSVDVYFTRWARESARVRGGLQCTLDVPYGDTARQRLDLFPAPRTGAPLFVYFHGGFWRGFDRDGFSFIAEPFVRAGAAVVIAGYTLATQGATLEQIVNESQRATAWAGSHAGQLNADARRIFVGGHSCGAQMAGMIASTDWVACGLPETPVAGIAGISGVYDLDPVRLCYVNEWLKVPDADTAARNSPVHRLPKLPVPLVAAVGEHETGEFKRQTRIYAAAWNAARYPVRHLEIAGHNHFSIVTELSAPGNPLFAALAELMAI